MSFTDHQPVDPTGASSAELEAAPVDRQADPVNWLSARALLIIVAVSIVVLIGAVIVGLLIWATPALDPVSLPTEPKI